ncbi:MAG: phosphatase PAP2 family protein [Clostridia bacterium]|nr:phosphatase PAP2 family protein [Clostridia bacterium]
MQRKIPFILSGILAGLFLVLLILLFVVDVGNIAPLEGKVGFSTINQEVQESIGGFKSSLYSLTKWSGYIGILSAAIFACFGLAQWVKRKSLLRVDKELFLLAGLYVAAIAFYFLFEVFVINVRPVLLAGETLPEPSFPSSHSMLAIVLFGGAALTLPRYLPSRSSAIAVSVLCWALMLFTVVGRFFSGVHWLTDIIGGILLGSSLLLAYFGFLRSLDERTMEALEANEVE